MTDVTFRLQDVPVDLGLGATAERQDTADISEPATALFITAGMGMEIRPR